MAAFLLAGALIGQPCHARISIDANPVTCFKQGKIQVSAAIRNNGDERAEDVSVMAGIGPQRTDTVRQELLETGDVLRAQWTLANIPQPPGLHTVVITTRYRDATGSLSSTLWALPVLTDDMEPDEAARLPLSQLSSTTLRRNGRITLKLNHPGSESLEATVALMLPDELTCADANRKISLPTRGTASLRFNVRNASGLRGSSHPVFAVIDYVENGKHFSVTAPARIAIQPFPSVNALLRWKGVFLPTILALLALFLVGQFPGWPRRLGCFDPGPFLRKLDGPWIVPCVFAVLYGFLLLQIPPALLLQNTLTTGGDTPAHSYLVSHLKKTLLSEGRIVSWAGGWWCGFPMFQYYFCLPYLAMALLSCLIPFNIAFKLVSVSGFFLLPASAYVAGRILRLPKPIPILLAIASMPFLFDNSNTMWGVNIYSTFAGMIANSISFPIMLTFLACAARDADEGQFRFRTVGLLVALIASHFFTSLMAAMMVAFLPFLRPSAGIRKALLTLAAECGLGLLLMAWWLVPLITKQSYSIDFGTNWDITLATSLPHCFWWWIPFALVPFALKEGRSLRGATLAGGMLVLSALCFQYGHRFSPVLANVRLWPFFTYSILALGAMGIGLLVQTLRASYLVVFAVLTISLTFGIPIPNTVPAWARWNYRGMENQARWSVFRDLVLPLRGTPGRLANDLHEDNQSLGSSRIFECVPHVIGKPILEGGIVNSAAGSLFSYYIQGETSETTAGYPNMVKPATFNFERATRHLEWFNVKHFIAHGDRSRRALAASIDWKRLSTSGDWDLYELITHAGNYVVVPANPPRAVQTVHWKKAGLEWIYAYGALDQPFAILDANERVPERFGPALNEEGFLRYLESRRNEKTPATPPALIDADLGAVEQEVISDSRIRFRTRAIGKPHIVKMTYFPNWKVRGADRVYRVTPCFMLVYPTQSEVELYYGPTVSDHVGYALSLLGLAALAAAVGRRGWKRKERTSCQSDTPIG